MGMLATAMNCMAVADVLEQKGVDVRIRPRWKLRRSRSLISAPAPSGTFEKGRVVIFGCGIGSPFFLHGYRGGAPRGGDQRGRYPAGEEHRRRVQRRPAKVADAVKYDAISHEDVLAQHLAVMDSTATSLSMDNHIPCSCSRSRTPKNILRAVMGEKIGTIVGE